MCDQRSLDTAGDTILRSLQCQRIDVGRDEAQTGLDKKYLLAAAVVVALIDGSISPPSGKEAAGTIDPAQRFQAPQVQASDVQLGGETAAKLRQTDSFELRVKDPSFRALFSDAPLMALVK